MCKCLFVQWIGLVDRIGLVNGTCELKVLGNILKKLKNLLSLRTEITIQIIDKNFNYHNPEPITVEGLLVDDEISKVVNHGTSQGVNLKIGWLNRMETALGDKIRKQFLVGKNGKDFCILLTKPKQEEIST